MTANLRKFMVAQTFQDTHPVEKMSAHLSCYCIGKMIKNMEFIIVAVNGRETMRVQEFWTFCIVVAGTETD